MRKYLINLINRITKLFIKILNRKGLRDFLCTFFTLLSKIFKDKNNKIYFDKKNKMFINKNSDCFFYIDRIPNWNISFHKLKNYVNDLILFDYIPLKGDVIIDLGAGVGTETIIFANEFGESCKVFLIEAHSETCKCLILLKKLNNLNNLIVINIVITDFKNDVYIKENIHHHSANSISSTNGIPVKAITKDEFVSIFNINRINFLKVNIEGAESMIKGMRKAIKIVDNVAISCHDFLFNEKSKKYNYKFFVRTRI